MNKYPVLQSGFVASSEKHVVKPNERNPETIARVLRVGGRLEDTKRFYSPEVTELYHEYSANPNVMRTMEFRERVLVAALTHIEERYFTKWINLQEKSPSLADIHISYLVDTIDYFTLDMSRRMDNLTWLPLISAEKHSKSLKVDVDGIVTHWRELIKGAPSIETKEVIAMWCEQKDGFTDLLTFLYIVFGDRFGQFGLGDPS